MNQSDRILLEQISEQLTGINERLTKVEEAINKGKGALGTILRLTSVAGLIIGSIKLKMWSGT